MYDLIVPLCCVARNMKKRARERAVAPPVNQEAWFKEVLLSSPARVTPVKSIKGDL